MIKITFQNFGGQGFASSRDVTPGTTVAQFFRKEMGPDANPGSYRIQRNGQPTTEDQLLANGDTIFLIANQKHEGA